MSRSFEKAPYYRLQGLVFLRIRNNRGVLCLECCSTGVAPDLPARAVGRLSGR